MPTMYVKLDFLLDLYATDKEDKAELSKEGEKKLDWIVLNYQGGDGYSEADYGLSIFPKDFLKGVDLELTFGIKTTIRVKGIAKVNLKADLYQYLTLDKAPKLSFSHIKMDPYAYLYADKNRKVVSINCSVTKQKPK